MNLAGIEHWSDAELKAHLKEVDELDTDVTAWEADFIESVAYGHSVSVHGMSMSQRECAIRVIEKYLG